MTATKEFVFECNDCEARLRVTDHEIEEQARNEAEEHGWSVDADNAYCPLHK